jgi:hypothetical protein
MSQHDGNSKRGDSSHLHPPAAARDQVETSDVVSSEAEFEQWLAKALEAERKRLREKSATAEKG